MQEPKHALFTPRAWVHAGTRPLGSDQVIAELERLRASDMVRVIDALAVYKNVEGDLEVEHLSNLTEEEAIELGTKIGALVGLGIGGEEGMEAGAEAGGGRGHRCLRRRR